jgi:hypothetical protein
MTSTREKSIRMLIAALTAGACSMGTASALAQGFGPDPFRPYNSQYDPYVYPLGPGGPGAGQSAAMNAAGVRRANQYQDFLNDLQGPSINNGERYGIGQPYFRSTVDPRYAPRYRPAFQPRALVEKSFEETQRLLYEKYFAYFEEKDPKKRALLLKDYTHARSLATRALSAGREDPARVLEAASRLGSGATARPAASSGASADADAARGGARSLPPPPPIPLGRSTRSGRGSTPTEILNRVNSPDAAKATDSQSKPATKSAKDKRSRTRPPAPSLSPSND